MAISQARIADVKKMTDQHELGCRVLVMRRYPQGFSKSNVDIWLPDAGPSLELLSAYREKLIDWEQFDQRYRAEQANAVSCRVVDYTDALFACNVVVSSSPLQVLRNLERLHGKVTVMCWEDTPCECHRHILVDLLSQVSV